MSGDSAEAELLQLKPPVHCSPGGRSFRLSQAATGAKTVDTVLAERKFEATAQHQSERAYSRQLRKYHGSQLVSVSYTDFTELPVRGSEHAWVVNVAGKHGIANLGPKQTCDNVVQQYDEEPRLMGCKSMKPAVLMSTLLKRHTDPCLFLANRSIL